MYVITPDRPAAVHHLGAARRRACRWCSSASCRGRRSAACCSCSARSRARTCARRSGRPASPSTSSPPAFGFWVPGLGRSKTTDWTISGAHFAERCQAFVLIALGESLVVIGGLTHLAHRGVPRHRGASSLAFAGAVALWWIYFDRQRRGQRRAHRGLGRPRPASRATRSTGCTSLMIGGIIVTAAADEFLLHDPGQDARGPIQWLVLGGTALFLGAHALFKAVVWRVASVAAHRRGDRAARPRAARAAHDRARRSARSPSRSSSRSRSATASCIRLWRRSTDLDLHRERIAQSRGLADVPRADLGVDVAH